MTEQADRVTQFKAEVAEMGLRDPVTKREQAMLRLGAALLVIGPIIAIASYFLSHNTINALQQRDAIVIALFGLSLTVAGGVLFLRYSFGRMLRFWLARFAFEQHGRGVPSTPSPAPAREPSRPLKAR